MVDQPEDNLDNGFVYGTIVDSIRKIKTQRQLIFVTHNPNIPVLGDAERVFVLQSDGRQGRKIKEGTVAARHPRETSHTHPQSTIRHLQIQNIGCPSGALVQIRRQGVIEPSQFLSLLSVASWRNEPSRLHRLNEREVRALFAQTVQPEQVGRSEGSAPTISMVAPA